MMTVALRFHAVARQSSSVWSCNGLRRMSPLRRYSSAASNVNETLPLAGIRVLDMTRVLAGVRLCLSGVYVEDKLTLVIVQPYCTQILGDLGYVQPEASVEQSLSCWPDWMLTNMQCRCHQGRTPSARRRYSSLGSTICEVRREFLKERTWRECILSSCMHSARSIIIANAHWLYRSTAIRSHLGCRSNTSRASRSSTNWPKNATSWLRTTSPVASRSTAWTMRH